MQLCSFKVKLLGEKRRPSQACPPRPSLPGNRSLWWQGAGTRFLLEKARESLSIRYLLKVTVSVLGLLQNLVLLHVPFEEMWNWRLLIMLTSCYTECFQIEDRQSDGFGHLGEAFAKKSKARLGQTSPKCFMQMLEASTHQSEECIPWSPVKIWCSRRAHSISWMPCASVPCCEGFDSQQTTAASSAVCLHKAHPCDGNAEFVLPPNVSQLFVPVFLNLLIITGGSRAAGAEWSWDLKRVTAVLGAMRTRNTARCIGGRSRNTDRSGQILALRKLSDHQELCKVDTTMWEASSDTDVGVRPPCDNLENNPWLGSEFLLRVCFRWGLSFCPVYLQGWFLWLSLQQDACRLLVVLWSGERTFWKSALQGLCHMC